MKVTKDCIEFSTGKRKYCYAGIIGLDDEGNVTYGSDGAIHMAEPVYELEPGEALTKPELVELADFMIARWTAFRASNNTGE